MTFGGGNRFHFKGVVNRSNMLHLIVLCSLALSNTSSYQSVIFKKERRLG